MPQDESFWNPYRLIPVKEDVRRVAPVTDEKFTGTSGYISCSLVNLTPLFVGKNRYNSQQFLTRKTTRGERYVIPGSSLKGMLRSLAEIVGGGCFVTGFQGQKTDSYIYGPCHKANNLCITCRMFGMMERGKNARVHRGNVSVSDALIREEKPEIQKFQLLLSNCGVRHEPFYRSPHTGTCDGKSRKLYFHQPQRIGSVPNVPENLKPRAWDVNALLPSHHFCFDVQFSNLSAEELNLLLYVLVLEESVKATVEGAGFTLKGPLRHKIGTAKPLGMGSCHMSINRLTYLAGPRERFSSLLSSGEKHLEGEALKAEISKRIRSHVDDKSITMETFRKIMVWDENDARNFRYPDYKWFKDPETSQKPLKRI